MDIKSIRQESSQRRASNKRDSPNVLRKAGIPFVEFNDGFHLRLGNENQFKIEFYPSTGLWLIAKDPTIRGRGVVSAITAFLTLNKDRHDA